MSSNIIDFSDSVTPLNGGGTYKGLVGRNKLPNGYGTEYYMLNDAADNVGKEKIFYQGYHLHGNRHGNGTLYYINGAIAYQGKFVNGEPSDGRSDLADQAKMIIDMNNQWFNRLKSSITDAHHG